MNRRDAIRLGLLGGAALSLNPQFLWANDIMKAPFTLSDFGDDWKWGVATSAYQIEGARNEDGKGPSIWDTFCRKKKKIIDGTTGDVACDFYHRYESDLELVKSMGFKVFRFSLSWSRIFPKGIGETNPKGVEFYHKVIDKCIALGLEPWITTFHWDLPQALQDKGGWTNRAVIDWFSEYVEFISKEYGSKVKNWMVLNEPAAFTAVGHMLGMHAPGMKSVKAFMASSHHATMVQAEGGRIIRKNVPNAYIGTTFSCMSIDPLKNKKRHHKAAKKIDGLLNRLFVEPALGMGYPFDSWKGLKRLKKHMEPGDEEKMGFDFDFIGLQNYSRLVVHFSLWPPALWANQQHPKKRTDDITEMEWEVYPNGIYRILKQFSEYEQIKDIIVTENGAAFHDEVTGNRVHDPRRVKFYHDYLWNVLKAKKEGVNLKGYFAWTFLDNFEWAEGYQARFGMVHVDFKTQQRIIKDSGLWWKAFLNAE